jgi:hypothetical protein
MMRRRRRRRRREEWLEENIMLELQEQLWLSAYNQIFPP